MYKIGDRVKFILNDKQIALGMKLTGTIVNIDSNNNWYCIEFETYTDERGHKHKDTEFVWRSAILEHVDNTVTRISRRLKNVAK